MGPVEPYPEISAAAAVAAAAAADITGVKPKYLPKIFRVIQ
jgi:hypothetical protein